MSDWFIVGFMLGFLIAFLFLVIGSALLYYRQEVRWYKDFDRRNPGVAEKLGVRERK